MWTVIIGALGIILGYMIARKTISDRLAALTADVIKLRFGIDIDRRVAPFILSAITVWGAQNIPPKDLAEISMDIVSRKKKSS